MKQIRRHIIAPLAGSLLAVIATTAISQTTTAPLQDKTSQDALYAMSRSSTQGHPDEYGEFNGMQRYAAGNYEAAMKYFLIGARYADKLSQLSIGLMYLNGEGVQKDPVTAFAWIAIAAERKYPEFLATRDQVWARLDAQQREQAMVLIDQLYPEYGDATAKQRMAKVLRRERSRMTGSYLGFAPESVASVTSGQFAQLVQMQSSGSRATMLATKLSSPAPPCGARAFDGAPITGCDNLYIAWRWDPKQYFKARDAAWTGTVSVGALQKVDASQLPVKQHDKQKDIQ